MTAEPTPSSLFDQARVLLHKGDVDGALGQVDRILGLDPNHLGALLLKARVHLEEREGTAALAWYERAARTWPRSAEALNDLARCLHAMGRDEEALAWAEKARSVLREGDNFTQAAAIYLTLVWCLREMRRFREAIAVAEEGLSVAPDAVLAQWASWIEDELVEAEKDRC